MGRHAECAMSDETLAPWVESMVESEAVARCDRTVLAGRSAECLMSRHACVCDVRRETLAVAREADVFTMDRAYGCIDI